MRQARPVVTALAGLVLFAPAACLRVDAAERLPNVLLVTLDGLRPEQLGAGTPAYAALAEHATVFREAYAAGGPARANAASLLTGLYPRHHGCTGLDGTLAAGQLSVLEAIYAAGIQTAALPSMSALELGGGLEQGVERWEPGELGPEEAARKAQLWLELQEQRGEPWCLWLHLQGEDAAAIDAALGAVRAKLAHTGQARDTITVLAGLWVTPPSEGPVDDARLRVPLVVHKEGVGGALVDEPVSIADVAPTLFELVGLDVPEGLDGESLAPGMLALPYERSPVYSAHADREIVVAGAWMLVAQDDGELTAYRRAELPLRAGEGSRPPDDERAALERELRILRGELARDEPE
jgi:membrane-anchored protein YejM (alkaline phosphatase superfamily)